ncbi:MAG: helix-turn-helix domain-containing protein [Pseudomonadota bacterium]
MNESFIQDGREPTKLSRRLGPQRSAAKLEAIARAACQVLARNGPRLTQVADVARAAGIAAGTVYVYVAEKDALVELALLHAARFDLPDPAKPVKFNKARLRRLTKHALEERLNWPALEAACRDHPSTQTLPIVLAETYDLLRREQSLIALFDSCAREVKMMEQLFIKGFRRRFFADFESCLTHLAETGYVRRDIDIAAATRATIEMLVWMAMRRSGDPDPPRCGEDVARAASIAFALSGLTNGSHA